MFESENFFKTPESQALNASSRAEKESSENIAPDSKKESKSEPKIEIDQAVLERAQRNLELARIINTEVDVEDKKELEIMQKLLERRSLMKVMNNLHQGDEVLTVLTPSNKFLSIKNLNDKVFGPQKTDTIIAQRRILVDQAFQNQIRKILDTRKDWKEKFSENNLNLEQNFKYGVYKIPQEIAEEVDMEKIMDSVDEEVGFQMKDFIQQMAEESLVEARDNLDEERIDNITFFLKDLNRDGFQLNCGISKVVQETSRDKITSLATSLRKAKLNFLNQGEYKNKDIKHSFVEGRVFLKEDLISRGNKIIDADGISYQIFNNGKINRDLLRDIRKDKFSPQDDEQREILRLLINYIDHLNTVDFMKPFTLDKIDDFEKEEDNLNQIKDNLDHQEGIIALQEKLKRNEKDEKFISNELFHSEAIKIDNCTYLNLDILDLGVDQLKHYEDQLEKVSAGEISLEEISIQVDDDANKKTQKVRDQVYEIISSYQDGALLNQDDLVVSLIGGDELCLAIDNDQIKEEDLNHLIFELKSKTNTRIVKTVIAKSERNSHSDDEKIRLKEHLFSLNNSEKGIEMIKEIEAEIRKLKIYLRDKVSVSSNLEGQDRYEALFKKINSEIEKMNLQSLIAVEDADKNIKFKSSAHGDLLTQKTVLSYIKEIKNKYGG